MYRREIQKVLRTCIPPTTTASRFVFLCTLCTSRATGWLKTSPKIVLPPTLTQILDVWEDRFADTIGPIVLVASDGDAVRRLMLYKFSSETIAPEFAVFKLIDARMSLGGLLYVLDLKHNCKRIRTRDLSKKGVTISEEGLALNRDSYPELFRWYDGKPEETYSSLFNVDDKCVCFLACRIFARF